MNGWQQRRERARNKRERRDEQGNGIRDGIRSESEWLAVSVISRAECRWQARAAIAAMREPTRGCLAAGVELVECWHPDIPPGEKPVRVAVVFDGVIDAALKEGQE